MKWNWLNAAGLAVVILMLVPNLIYVCRVRPSPPPCRNRYMNLLEQAGRYGAMLFMVVPLGVPGCEFAFSSTRHFEVFLCWLALAAILLIFYNVYWFRFFKKASLKTAMVLAVIPSILFIGHGLALRHGLLCLFGALFAAGHCCVTAQNYR